MHHGLLLLDLEIQGAQSDTDVAHDHGKTMTANDSRRHKKVGVPPPCVSRMATLRGAERRSTGRCVAGGDTR